jgi:DNA-3-methyladenine glycosylase
MRALNTDFYLQETTAVARELLGSVLMRRTAKGILSGRIVETEAYISNDPANHAFRGKTRRNETMFGPPGRAYVYAIHRYHCLNLVTQPEGVAEAVLIRALEPLEGVDMMKRNRATDDLHLLAAGPGRLCQAFAIDRILDGASLAKGDLAVLEGNRCSNILCAPRVGVTAGKGLPLRFFVKGSRFVSPPRNLK